VGDGSRRLREAAAGREHDDPYTDEADGRSDQIVTVGTEPVEDHAPSQGTCDEHSPVGSQDPSEVGAVLEGGHESVEGESGNAGGDVVPAFVFSHSLPDQIGPADLS
jgi:hypothetical protein